MTPTEQAQNDSSRGSRRDPRLIAFYLPQYHPTPENDVWWGKGATEWTNVARAKPLFPGHYQPRLPADLGFYDLRLPEVRQAQADLAREYGIHGFCYYHYWFKGTRLLERPFNEMLESGQPDFPFCLCWANHTWSWRRGHGDQGRIMPQEYSEEDDREHIRWLLKVFRDERYIRVGGRPLLMIYSAHSMPDPARTFAMWKEEARKAGEAKPYICKAESFNNYDDPAGFGCDAACEFWPHGMNGLARYTPVPEEVYGDATIFEYAEVAAGHLKRPGPPFKRFPCIVPHWDTTARFRPTGPRIVRGSTPDLYGSWLEGVIDKTTSTLPPEEQLIFVNAWNEWGEGSYLEPDFKYGRAYLEATRDALRASGIEVPEISSPDGVETGGSAPAPASTEKLYGDLLAKYERLQRRYTEQLSLEERSPLLQKAQQRVEALEQSYKTLQQQHRKLERKHAELETLSSQLADKQRESGDVEKLKRWMRELDAGISTLLNSRRWKLGSLILGVAQRSSKKGRRPTVEDQLVKTLGKYREWRGRSDRK